LNESNNDAFLTSLLDSLSEGDVIDGKVARLTNFGAFIDIGGVDGLVHVSELSHEHVESPEQVVSVGDNVKVKVKSVEKDSERISLSIKDTLPTPFENIKGKFHEDDVIEGTVVRLANFGAFVEIAPAVQGLVHISEIDHKHIGSPSEKLEPGQQVNVKILGIDEENERISLSIKATLPKEDVIESDESTTQSYLENDNDEDNPTLGDVFGDKFKDLKF
ncbi:S1 RNA-binding domain-containing protein, partial [Staphylococcus capitis]|uniref:S1 RNA-binding domain-containing protein n=1 Tax=Staphylococcus capitis TaxID=29388 RepID=UPI003CFDD099